MGKIQKIKPMDFRKVLFIVAKAGKNRETVLIYYPQTENSKEGWREIEPYSLATDVGKAGEHLIYGKDLLSPGHILNGYTRGSEKNHCDSFIIGKISDAKLSGRKFKPRNDWRVEF